MSQAKLARPSLARHPTMSRNERSTMSDHLRSGHLGAQSCEDVSRETDRATSGQGISEPRVARISQAKLAGQPRARHFGTQSCEDVSSETGWTISHASYRSLELRGRRRRNLPDHLSRCLSEHTIAGGRVRRRARARRRGNSRRHCHRHHRRPFPLPFPPVPPALPRPPPLSSSVRAEPARGPAEPTARNRRERRREGRRGKRKKGRRGGRSLWRLYQQRFLVRRTLKTPPCERDFARCDRGPCGCGPRNGSRAGAPLRLLRRRYPNALLCEAARVRRALFLMVSVSGSPPARRGSHAAQRGDPRNGGL